MKRWIHASTSASVFNRNTTNTSYYDNFLNEKDLKYMQTAKNLDGHIEMMSPSEYFEICAKQIFKGRHTAEQLKRQREVTKDRDGNQLIAQYEDAMKAGKQFPLCFLNYADSSQEGLHRMYAAGEAFGWDIKFPVLVIEPYDIDRWNDMQFNRMVSDYKRFDFKYVVKEAQNAIMDWDIPVPDDVEEQMRKAVIESAAIYEDEPHNIDVEVDISEDDSQLEISIVSIDGKELDQITVDAKVWLDDMFDTEAVSDLETNNKEIDLDDLDVNDLDLFF